MLTATSSATMVDGDALLRVAWVVLIWAIGLIIKKAVEDYFDLDLGGARRWLRERTFELLLIKSQPSPLAAKTADLLMSWLASVPGIPAKRLRILDPKVHKHGLREVVFCAISILWGASMEARTQDRTLQFGMWIRLVGVVTVGLGVQFALSGETWLLVLMESALGVALMGVGHFLGSLRWRRGLWGALLLLGPAAMGLDGRFAIAGSGGPVQAVVEAVRQLGSVMAAVACVLVAVSLRLGRGKSAGASDSTLRAKAWLIRWGMRSAGLACLCYSLANLSQAFMVSPTMIMQATHLMISICLAMAATECRHPATRYRRLTSG